MALWSIVYALYIYLHINSSESNVIIVISENHNLTPVISVIIECYFEHDCKTENP